MRFRSSSGNSDRLVADVKQVIADLDALLRDSASTAGDEAAGLRERMRDGLRSARHSVGDLEDMLRDRAREAQDRALAAARYTDEYVQEHPWTVVGAAAGVGALIALLLYATRR